MNGNILIQDQFIEFQLILMDFYYIILHFCSGVHIHSWTHFNEWELNLIFEWGQLETQAWSFMTSRLGLSIIFLIELVCRKNGFLEKGYVVPQVWLHRASWITTVCRQSFSLTFWLHCNGVCVCTLNILPTFLFTRFFFAYAAVWTCEMAHCYIISGWQNFFIHYSALDPPVHILLWGQKSPHKVSGRLDLLDWDDSSTTVVHTNSTKALYVLCDVVGISLSKPIILWRASISLEMCCSGNGFFIDHPIFNRKTSFFF